MEETYMDKEKIVSQIEQLPEDNIITLWNEMQGMYVGGEEITESIEDVDLDELIDWLLSDGKDWLMDYGIF